MRTNYDFIAGPYDFLGRVVFGDALLGAQMMGLPHIPAAGRVLVVGGGTGLILEEMAKIHPTGLDITYVELSAAMLKRARTRNCGGNRIHFVHQAIEEFWDEHPFDVVLTPFLFDNFPEPHIPEVFNRIRDLLKPGGVWLYTDFTYPSRPGLWQRLLLAGMYLFFRMVSGVKAKQLTDMAPFFVPEFEPMAEAFFYSGFIQSAVYSRRLK